MKILGKDGKVAGTLKEAAERPAVDPLIVEDSTCPLRHAASFIPGLDPITQSPQFVGISEHRYQCRRDCMLWASGDEAVDAGLRPAHEVRGYCRLGGKSG